MNGHTETDQEVRLEPDLEKLAQKTGVTEESLAIVDAEVRDGELYVTVAGTKNLHETAHRLPDELQETTRRSAGTRGEQR